MAEMVKCKCAHCGAPFEARVADRRRGWGRYCSKSCKAKKQLRRTGRARVNHDIDDYCATDVDISDLDFGASDGGGYESIRGDY